jgi:hypothetical protein
MAREQYSASVPHPEPEDGEARCSTVSEDQLTVRIPRVLSSSARETGCTERHRLAETLHVNAVLSSRWLRPETTAGQSLYCIASPAGAMERFPTTDLATMALETT